MYNIYVTNKLQNFVYVRLSVEKIGNLQKIKEDYEVIGKKGNCNQLDKEYISFLAINGFCLIPPANTRAFLVQNVEAFMYVSTVSYNTIWETNYAIDPKMYGCVAILPSGHNFTTVSSYNPEAVWLPAKTGDQLPTDVIKAGRGRYKEHLYFGRNASVDGGMPCTVTSNGGKLCNMWLIAGNVTHKSGEFLKNTGFELIRAKRGDPIPPNAVMTGVTEADGSLYVGRVGGSIPCYITTEDGKIQSFVYGSDSEKRVANGEVMVLTR